MSPGGVTNFTLFLCCSFLPPPLLLPMKTKKPPVSTFRDDISYVHMQFVLLHTLHIMNMSLYPWHTSNCSCSALAFIMSSALSVNWFIETLVNI